MRRKNFSSIVCSVVGSITILVVSLSASTKTSHPRLTQVTWSADIAPIIQRRCVGCHVDGGFGPMPLTRFEDARNWSRAISEHAMDGLMPPWPAAVGIGDFSNDRSLTPIEIELLAAWAEGGGAEGAPSPAPSPSMHVVPRTPDLSKELPQSSDANPRVMRYDVPAENDAERWITGWEFHPRDHARVERAVIGIAGTGRVASWIPPETMVSFPDGVAHRLPPRSTLTVDVHYRKSSSPLAQGGRLALYFGATPRHEVHHRTLPCGATVLDADVDLLAIEPTANESGAMVEAVARRPDRSIEPLILVRRYLTWYVPTYRFRSAVRLPRGSRLDVRSSAGTCGAGLDYVPAR